MTTSNSTSSTHSTPPRPYDAIMLDVGDGHWIYVEEVGNRDGIPALFLHGGPGSGSQHAHRNLFDPTRHRAILFDQRGAGRSHPYLSRHANTTQHLVQDIEKIRLHMGVERWLVVGGSWGSTLALAYAEAFPERVTGLVLRAVFLGRRQDVEWAFLEGPRQIWPDLYSAFVDWLPDGERTQPLDAYVARLTDPDPNVHHPAAQMWAAYERCLSELVPQQAKLPGDDVLKDRARRLPPTAIMEAHYIQSNFFLENDQILENIREIKNIPGVIVQGRYDLLCPPSGAFELAKYWDNARLEFIACAGHSITDDGVFEAMRMAVNELTPK